MTMTSMTEGSGVLVKMGPAKCGQRLYSPEAAMFSDRMLHDPILQLISGLTKRGRPKKEA
jgi:hypothetical protein